MEVLLELAADPNAHSVEDEGRSIMGQLMVFSVRNGATRWDMEYGLQILEFMAEEGAGSISRNSERERSGSYSEY